MSSIDFLIDKVVLADLGSYQVSGRLPSSRGDDTTLQTQSGSRIVVNRQETTTARELGVGKRRRA